MGMIGKNLILWQARRISIDSSTTTGGGGGGGCYDVNFVTSGCAYDISPKNYPSSSPFVVFCFGLVQIRFAHNFQVYLTGTGAIIMMIDPMPMK